MTSSSVDHMYARDAAQSRAGFTLIELITVIAISMVLLGLLLGALGLVRGSAERRKTLQTLGLLRQAMQLYQTEQRSYPEMDDTAPDQRALFRTDTPGLQLGVMAVFDRAGYFAATSGDFDAQQRLIDPWGQPYRYVLWRRHPGTANAMLEQGLTAPGMDAGTRFPTWNWDRERTRERRYGRFWNAFTSPAGEVTGALPYPYLYSWGRHGTATDATDWLFLHDGEG